MDTWFYVENTQRILSPAILFYPDRIRSNINAMVQIAGTPERLRPHIKTHKCQKIIEMQVEAGISKYKCATLVEAHLLGEAGVKDVLVAYPMIEPNLPRFIELASQFPNTKFGCLVDHPDHLAAWNKYPTPNISLFIDVDLGMNRTGVAPENLISLLEKMEDFKLPFEGLHIYDGDNHEMDSVQRITKMNKSFDKILPIIDPVTKIMGNNYEIVCGGSITFPAHAAHPERSLSPGTTLLWDHGYQAHFPDLPFKIAAAILTRVISKPGANRICLDVGHKAVGSEMDVVPIFFPKLPAYQVIMHSEEHLVLEIMSAHNIKIGDELFGFPTHICPTVALHEKAAIIKDHRLVDFWEISARNRYYH